MPESDLPPPPIAADVDCRNLPFPLKRMAASFADALGIPLSQAEAMFRGLARYSGIWIEGEDH